jgi:ABC-type transport system involved in Fe-S cluster assembly fused permease/ATPase subunit
MWDAFTGTKADSIGNALTVKSFGSEDYEISFVQKVYQNARDARIKALNKAQDLLRIQNMAIVGFEVCALLLLICSSLR